MKAITSYFKKQNTDNNSLREQKIDKFYEYRPREFLAIDYQKLYDEIKNNLRENNSRKTCILTSEEDMLKIRDIYNTLNIGVWTPIVKYIKEELEVIFNKKIDYGLVQYYENGNSNISWHNDKEALNSYVFSVSFGTIRHFNIRDIDTKKTVDKFTLIHGDVFYMKDGFQKKYEHCIPVEKNVKNSRISITFRVFEN